MMMMSNNNHNATSTASAAQQASATAAITKNTLWDNVGNVNIDLDNLSLRGGANKGKGVPMNALVTPTSSPQKPALGGFGGGPPPLKSVQSGGSSSQPASQSSFDFNDLLN